MPAAVGTPLITPVLELMVRPVGSPDAEYASVDGADVSDPVIVSGEMALPDEWAWGPGSATVTLLVTVQANRVLPWEPALSVAVTVTVYEPPVVGVPDTVPVDGPIDSPAGSPVAE
jgi:hypothetical protein